jgi:hypothetical protein
MISNRQLKMIESTTAIPKSFDSASQMQIRRIGFSCRNTKRTLSTTSPLISSSMKVAFIVPLDGLRLIISLKYDTELPYSCDVEIAVCGLAPLMASRLNLLALRKRPDRVLSNSEASKDREVVAGEKFRT